MISDDGGKLGDQNTVVSILDVISDSDLRTLRCPRTKHEGILKFDLLEAILPESEVC